MSRTHPVRTYLSCIVIWTVFAFIIIVGALYYFTVQRRKPYEAVHPPDEEDLAGIAPA